MTICKRRRGFVSHIFWVTWIGLKSSNDRASLKKKWATDRSTPLIISISMEKIIMKNWNNWGSNRKKWEISKPKCKIITSEVESTFIKKKTIWKYLQNFERWMVERVWVYHRKHNVCKIEGPQEARRLELILFYAGVIYIYAVTKKTELNVVFDQYVP